jgi:hypothetical protein
MSKESVVTIRQHGDGWQASVPVLRSEFARLPGVKGTQSESGPWIGGFGVTPDEALRELHVEIGRLLLPVVLLPSEEKKT